MVVYCVNTQWSVSSLSGQCHHSVFGVITSCVITSSPHHHIITIKIKKKEKEIK